MIRQRRDPAWVGKVPIVTTFLLEAANVQQLVRMWTERTAAGQSLTAWMSVNVALWLWLQFYHTFTPDQRLAIWGTRVGIALNSAVILTVVFFRYLA